MSSRKIYCSNGYTNYCNWLGTPTHTLHHADIVMMTGGEDVSPSYYNQRQSVTTYPNIRRDQEELVLLNRAIDMNIPIIGTCRGFQLITVFMGGSLIQDINHPYWHEITLANGQKAHTNSLHHQLCNPLPIKKNKYEILAWGSHITPTMFNGRDENIIRRPYGRILSEKEPEAIIFPSIRALGVQGHPEMMEMNNYVEFLLTKVEELWK
jgi:putative glutamine amidotransferase